MLTTLMASALVINELMAANLGTVMSPAINFDSWIELYNPDDTPVNLGGMYLSDNGADLHRWKMPTDVGSVPAKGFKVIWLGSHDIKASQAPFKLDADGGTIYLSDADGTLVLSQEYPECMSRTAWARITDGGDTWGWTATATPGASNATASFASERLPAPVVSVGSKLFSSSLNFNVEIPEGATLMYTTDGSLPSAPKADGEEGDPWVECVRNGDCEGDDASSLISRDAGGNGNVKRIVDGVGCDGSRGIRVHAIANPKYDYDAQLFVYTPDHIWRPGQKYRFSMMVRADKPSRISAQTHTTPGNYIYWQILAGNYDITTEWQEIYYEGTITDEHVGKQGGWWGGQENYQDMQTIAFNLNGDKQENNFYFDNVSWQLYTGDDSGADATRKSEDGQFTISRTTNYVFRLYKDGYLPRVPVTRSFIQTSNYSPLPLISIVGEKRYFTDPKIGLDCDGDGTNGRTGNGQDQPKNYNQPWDRPVNFSYLSPEGEMLFNQDVNIKVSGGYTRSQQYRSFKLKSNKVFDGQNRFDFSFFPQKPYIRSKTLLVRNGGNDIWRHNARFIDPALETIIQRSGIDLDVQSYVPVIEYVNGQLRGVLNLREPNNDSFAYANFGYDDDELDAFENLKMKNGNDSVINRIFELGRHINDPGAYDELISLLDIDEFTNYMAVTLFLYNDDWPDNNIKAYRSRNDGRYRFISFDLDYAFKGCWDYSGTDPFVTFYKFKDSSAPRSSYNKDIVNLLLNLLNNDGFRRRFIDTFCIVAGSVFEPTRSGMIVDELLANVKPMCQLMKQQGINDGHDPDRAANTIKNELRGRSATMTNYMKQFAPMKLSTVTRQKVTLTTNLSTQTANPSTLTASLITINGLRVPYSYFDGHLFGPVRIEAQIPAGYRFAGWKSGNDLISTEPIIDLSDGSTISLTAIYQLLSSEDSAAQGIPPVRINEVSAANDIYVNDYFKRNDWVELYNTTSEPIDIEGMYLSDNAKEPQKYQIQSSIFNLQSTVIPAHGYLVVWCDKLEPLNQLHASFKLDAEGGEVLLTAADESWTDQLTYIQMKSDETIGRYPDGCADVITMNMPTIATFNCASSYAMPVSQTMSIGNLVAAGSLTVYYATERIVISCNNDGPVSVNIVNLIGQQQLSLIAEVSGGCAEADISLLPVGCYIAIVADGNGQRTVSMFIKN